MNLCVLRLTLVAACMMMLPPVALLSQAANTQTKTPTTRESGEAAGELKILSPGTYQDVAKRVTAASGRVVRTPAKYVRHVFKPQDKASTPVKAGEAAVCVSNFSSNLSYDATVPEKKKDANGTWTVRIQVTKASATVTMENHVWLPEGFWKGLEDHEEGHRQIAEIVYVQSLEPLAEAIKAVDGAWFSGSGDTVEKATAAAKEAVFEAFNRRYAACLPEREDRLQKRYDTVTSHGMNDQKTAEQFMNEVLASEKPPASAEKKVTTTQKGRKGE